MQSTAQPFDCNYPMTKSPDELLQEFEPIFYPRSIAVVGVPQGDLRIGSAWAKSLMEVGFDGPIYPVDRRGGEFLGSKIYPSLTSIPGPVDYVIVIIPRKATPDLLDECSAKKVKAVHFYTAGFSEMGDQTGYDLEKELVKKAQQGGFRIIGPNCIGVYCPESNFPYGPMIDAGSIGTVGFISQSGGIGGKLVEIGPARGIKYSKGISFGNGIDIDGVDFLEYMAADPKTSVIGTYLEGTRDGRRLFNTMKEVTKIKPLIVWKGGRTDVGAAAAKSHTGSLASSRNIWSAMLRQTGAIEVSNLEELADELLIFQQLQRWQGKGVAIISGVGEGGGGTSVASGDICTEHGLSIPNLAKSTMKKLNNLLGQVGSIVHNPVDISQGGGIPSILQEAIELVFADTAIDLVIIQENVGVLAANLPPELVEAINNSFLDIKTKQSKPMTVVLPPGSYETVRLDIVDKLSQASIPVFPTMERAAKAIANLSRYSRFQAAIKSP